MKVYLPNALVQKKDGTVERRITYDSCISIKEAEKVIDFWKNNENVLCAWVEQDNGTLIELAFFRDSIGNKTSGVWKCTSVLSGESTS